MAAKLKLEGRVFDRLTVLSFQGFDRHNKSKWKCLCSCGKETVVGGSDLVSNKVCSCGCFGLEMRTASVVTHGMSHKVREYNVWRSIRNRCNNKKYKEFYLYGGRGISICKEWESFSKFYEDMGKMPTEKHSIDRIDNSKGYCKENCRWATSTEQNRNKRSNKIVTYQNRKYTIAELAEISQVNDRTLWKRIVLRGWDVAKAVETPTIINRRSS